MAGQRKKSAGRKTAVVDGWLTSGRKREILGSALVALAVVTLLGFVTRPGVITSTWLDALRWTFGWGAVFTPFLMVAVGAWLVLDAVDGEATAPWPRAAAGGVAFLAFLGLVHLVTASRGDMPDAAGLAHSGMGGGHVGWLVAGALSSALGTAAAAVVCCVVGVVAATMTLGVTMRELVTELRRLARAAVEAAGRLRPPELPWLDDEDDDAPIVPVPAVAQAVPAPVAAPPQHPLPPVKDMPGRNGVSVEDLLPGAAVRGGRPARWHLPDIGDVLEPVPATIATTDDAEAKARLIERTLGEFGVPARVVDISRGPTVTQFGVEPGYIDRAGQQVRVKVSRVVALQNDLALALAASPLRVQAPVPGRPFIGIEVPNAASSAVPLRGVLQSDAFRKVASKGALPIALGRDTSGHPVAADLAAMPHLLIAGATGSGKSVALNVVVCSMLVTHTPDTLKILLIDPKRVEMAPYRGLPHLAAPVIVDVERVVGVLQWAVREMDRRYRLFSEKGARHVQAYNDTAVRLGEDPLPYLVIVVDELADLMMAAPEEVERLITRLAQLARATGIHLIIATQRPSVDVVTGLIKANFPSRIAFAVASSTDSRVILDSVGADKLLGRGDMLYMASDSSKLERLQGCFVGDAEIQRIVAFWQRAVPESPATTEAVEKVGVPVPLIEAEAWDAIMTDEPDDERDPLWSEAVAVLREHQAASTSFLQRKLRIGYSRAARLMDELEAAGYVGPAQGNQSREVLVEFDDEGRVVFEPPTPAPPEPVAVEDVDAGA